MFHIPVVSFSCIWYFCWHFLGSKYQCGYEFQVFVCCFVRSTVSVTPCVVKLNVLCCNKFKLTDFILFYVLCRCSWSSGVCQLLHFANPWQFLWVWPNGITSSTYFLSSQLLKHVLLTKIMFFEAHIKRHIDRQEIHKSQLYFVVKQLRLEIVQIMNWTAF